MSGLAKNDGNVHGRVEIRRSNAWIAHVLLLAVWMSAGTANSDIVLDPPNLTGQVGLEGETFGSGTVSVSPVGQGGLSAPLVNGDTDFAFRIEPGHTFSLSVSLSSFQNTSSAFFRCSGPINRRSP